MILWIFINAMSFCNTVTNKDMNFNATKVKFYIEVLKKRNLIGNTTEDVLHMFIDRSFNKGHKTQLEQEI